MIKIKELFIYLNFLHNLHHDKKEIYHGKEQHNRDSLQIKCILT